MSHLLPKDILDSAFDAAPGVARVVKDNVIVDVKRGFSELSESITSAGYYIGCGWCICNWV